MPRIYSQNETHSCDFAAVPFTEGAAAVAADEDIEYFLDRSDVYTVDYSKDKLMLWDKMTVPELDEFYGYLGGVPSSDDTKAEKVRKIESAISAKFIGSVNVASAAATTGDGKTKITITTPDTNDYYFKSAATNAPAPLFGDVITEAAGWQKLDLTDGVADEVEPNDAADDKFAVVEVSADGTVIAISSGNLTVKS